MAHRIWIGAALATLAVAGPVAGPAGLASGAPIDPHLTATTSGTVVEIEVYDGAIVTLGCTGGAASVSVETDQTGPTPTVVVASPSLACALVTEVVVTTVSSGVVQLDASPLDGPAFSAQPHLVTQLGSGEDRVVETRRADDLDLGGNNDQLVLAVGTVPNIANDLGTGLDQVYLEGTSGDDVLVAQRQGAEASVSAQTPEGTSTWALAGAERFRFLGGAGDDVLDGSAVYGPAGEAGWLADGGLGDDRLVGGQGFSGLSGGDGANLIEAGTGLDFVSASSERDVVVGAADDQNDVVADDGSPRSGGRTLSGFANTSAANDTFATYSRRQEVTARIRPGADAGTAVVTLSMDRPGQQVVPAGFETQLLALATGSSPIRRVLADVVLTSRNCRIELTYGMTAVVDITVPVGSWTVTTPGDVVVTTDDPTIGTCRFQPWADYRVHGPWVDRDQGFAHRATRDLLMRFATDSARDQLRDQLASGTTTRAQAVRSIMGTDEYRGLDVDRSFLRILGRSADPSGRSYWINSIRNGKALWRFRAQLFGSNEYFTKAGGTNAAYVEKAYTDVLGRTPDAGGRAYWTNKLNKGADRGSVALQFLNSPEARRRVVDDQFLRFVDRKPTAPEQTTWVNALPGATGEQDLVAFLASSTSYYGRS